jgi:hypothetical protein
VLCGVACSRSGFYGCLVRLCVVLSCQLMGVGVGSRASGAVGCQSAMLVTWFECNGYYMCELCISVGFRCRFVGGLRPSVVGVVCCRSGSCGCGGLLCVDVGFGSRVMWGCKLRYASILTSFSPLSYTDFAIFALDCPARWWAGLRCLVRNVCCIGGAGGEI